MKNKLRILLTIALCLSVLTGCSSGTTVDNASQVVPDATAETEKSETEEAEAEKSGTGSADTDIVPEKIVIEKSGLTNPIANLRDENGDIVYGGDPAVYVDNDTVYLYTGHDMSTDKEVSEAAYHIPEYLCYSSKDLREWNYEGVVMKMTDVEWAGDSKSAWASQVIKHDDKYYLYYCSWDKTSRKKQSIGVAVADCPTGPFTDIGKPLVSALLTKPESNAWNDIDPTVWVETGEDGEEHRYLAWGNSLFYICELNEDMISVKDLNGDGEITGGFKAGECDILNRTMNLTNYTEAPWIYRRSDEEGNYYGDYYLFYATEWRESMGYVRTDDLFTGEWRDYRKFMDPTATCNTNHEAIFDFNGKTYMMYHDGSMPGGNGYRRSACLQEIIFDENGDVEFMEESASGLYGKAFKLSCKNGGEVRHEEFICSSDDKAYPYTDVPVGKNLSEKEKDGLWVITAGKSDPDDETLISIEAENKTGLFLTVKNDNTVVLSQDTDASAETALAQTFKTVSALDGSDGVSFESAANEGMYIYADDNGLTLKNIDEMTDEKTRSGAVFIIE